MVVETGPVQGPWDLPHGWRWESLASVGQWGSGGTPKAKTPSFYGGDIPWFKIGDLRDGWTKQPEQTITELGLSQSSAKMVPANTLLVAMYGSIGKLGLTSFPCATNQAIAFCIPHIDKVELKWLFYYLHGRRSHLLSLGKGGTQQNISQTVLLQEPVPVPPLNTQRCIVARIDDLFSELDDGEAALARARADLETYRKSLLKAAVTGELTADWRAANPPLQTGEQLLRRILADRKARWEADPKNKGKRYRQAMEPTSKLPELPGGWAWCTVDQLITGLRNGLSDKPNNQPPGTPIFKISAVRELEVRTSEIRWLPENVAVAEATVAQGDLLFTRYNGSPDLVGVCGRYRGEIPVAYPDKLMRARPVSQDSGLTDFIELAANCGATRAYIQSYTKTSAGQHGVSGETVKSAPVPLPSLPEAIEIARRFRKSLDARADASASLDRQATGSNDLRRSILAAAFRGELVQ